MNTTTPLSLLDGIRQRRSVRGFHPRPVPADVLRGIFALASRAPSNCNVQPWEVFVASGASRDALRERLVARACAGAPMQADFDTMPEVRDTHRRRQVECAQAMYGAMGIARDDRAGRQRAALRNFELFDAPHVAFLGMRREYGTAMAVSVGMYAQTLMLAMTAHGVGSCAMGTMAYYAPDVHALLGIPDDIGLLFGIAFGYEDASVTANDTRTTRADLDENVHFRD